VVLAGLFVAFLQVGGINLQVYGFVPEVVDVILAAIIFSCAFAEHIGKFYLLRLNARLSRLLQAAEAGAEASPGQSPPGGAAAPETGREGSLQ